MKTTEIFAALVFAGDKLVCVDGVARKVAHVALGRAADGEKIARIHLTGDERPTEYRAGETVRIAA
jgi:adenosyl cobinamide kinase/adenosyl cobinamide phosphate guanylyltransferase